MRSSALRVLIGTVACAALSTPLAARADEEAPQEDVRFGEGGGMFNQVDGRTGAMTYAYRFQLPAARGLSGPSLALQYNSSLGDGSVAYGWRLDVPAIEARPLSGVPRFNPDGTPKGEERYSFNGSPLVRICQVGGACPSEPSTQGHPSWANGWTYYRMQDEGLFARLYFHANRQTWRVLLKGGELVELGAPTEEFGPAFGLPAALERGLNDVGVIRWLPVSRRSLNHTNNVILYRWQKLGSRGIAYLTDLWDTPLTGGSASLDTFAHHTQLTWTPIADLANSQALPTRARPDFRLERIGVASMPWSGAGDREIYRQYELEYLLPAFVPGGAPFGPFSPLWNHTFLQRIVERGHCLGNKEQGGTIPQVQCSTLPATEFDYEPATRSVFDAYRPTIENGVPNATVDSNVLPWVKSAAIVDFNRDGLPDVVQSWEHYCFTKRWVQVRDVNGAPHLYCVDPSHVYDDVYLRSARPIIGYENTRPTAMAGAHVFGYRCMDAGPLADPFSISKLNIDNGPDGPELFTAKGNTVLGAFGVGLGIWGRNEYFPFIARPVSAQPGAGAEPAASGCRLDGTFDPASFHPSWRWQSGRVESWTMRAPREAVVNEEPEWNVDVDGDGYPDALRPVEGATPIGVYRPAKVAFTRKYSANEPIPALSGPGAVRPHLVPFVEDVAAPTNSMVPIETPWEAGGSTASRAQVNYADVNGDGFADALSIDYNVFPRAIRVFPGDGTGRFGCSGTEGFACTPAPGWNTFYELQIGGPIKPWDYAPIIPPRVPVFEIHDVTGDGLPDIVRAHRNGAVVDVDVWVNLDGRNFDCVGAGPTPCLVGRFHSNGVDASGQLDGRLAFADMNADGVSDIVWLAPDGIFVGSFFEQTPMYAPGPRGTHPGQLIRVRSGRGSHLEVRYESLQELDVAARSSSSPWTHHSPVVESVVTELRTVDDGTAAGAPPAAPLGVDRRVLYTYRDPAYDGWQRRFLGFRKVASRIGSESAVTETTYWFGPCENAATPVEPWQTGGEARCWYTSDDEFPYEPSYRAWVGKPVLVERYIPGAVTQGAPQYLWSRSYEYEAPTTLLTSERRVTFSYAKRIETHHYAPEAPTSPGSQLTFLPGGDAIPLPRIQAGARIVAQRVTMDTNGTVVETAELGEEAAYDMGRVTQLSDAPWGAAPTVTCDEKWNCLPSYVSISEAWAGTPSPPTRQQHLTYDPTTRDLAKIEGYLAETHALSRAHENPARTFSAGPPGAATAGWKTLSELDYSADGFVIRERGPGAAGADPARSCTQIVPDAEYGQFPRVIRLTKGGCDSGTSLESMLVFDRGFGVVVQRVAPDLGLSITELDPFGRVQDVYAPKPDVVGAFEHVEHMTYQDTGPLPFVETQRFTTDATFIRSVQLFNKALEPVLGFEQGDGGDWTVSAWVERDLSGRVAATRRPFSTATDPLAVAASGAPPAAPATGVIGRLSDAFGRATGVREDLKTIQTRTLAPMRVETRDEEQLAGGTHVGAFTQTNLDGHGRVTSVVRHTAEGDFATTTAHDIFGNPLTITRSGPGGVSSSRSLVWDSLGRMIRNDEPNTTDPGNGRPIWYAWDDHNRLVGTSDARGCGEDLYYDSLGRPIGEDFSPCLTSHELYSAPNLVTGEGLESRSFYDEYEPGQVAPEPGFADAEELAAGRLTRTIDRGSITRTSYDVRGSARRVSRRVAKPRSQQGVGLDPYAPHWFTSRRDFDRLGRPTFQTTGAGEGIDDPFLANPSGSSAETYTYSARGLLTAVNSSYGAVLSNIAYEHDGLVKEVHYGDLAGTTSLLTYDARRRLDTFAASRAAAPLLWSGPAAGYTQPTAATTPLSLVDFKYTYDFVGNPQRIEDRAPTAGLPEDAWPVRQRDVSYDDFYRVKVVSYGYGTPGGDAAFKVPFRAEVNAGDRRPVPLQAQLPTRVREQSFAYDFLGNTTSTGDDLSASYDRSLGAITNGDGSGYGPNQLRAANGVAARYDGAGNLVELKVTRTGDCLSGAGSHCAQWFAYDWDEIGQLARARRWDFETTLPELAPFEVPAESPQWDLTYAYSAGQRVVKSAKDALGVERHTLEVFSSLRFERDEFDAVAGDYERHRAATHVYLAGGTGHVFYDGGQLPAPPGTPPVRMFLNVGDHLGSATVTIDHTTSELVERATFHAFGATESDYRPTRWAAAREPYKFTGKEEDVEVGAVYFGARFYNAHLGRFISPDPLTVHGLGADPNPYAYVSGRVFSHVDPVGLAGLGVDSDNLPPPMIPQVGTFASDGTVVTVTCSPCASSFEMLGVVFSPTPIMGGAEVTLPNVLAGTAHIPVGGMSVGDAGAYFTPNGAAEVGRNPRRPRLRGSRNEPRRRGSERLQPRRRHRRHHPRQPRRRQSGHGWEGWRGSRRRRRRWGGGQECSGRSRGSGRRRG